MENCNCKIWYESEDGMLFSTPENCQQHENFPHVWVVKGADSMRGGPSTILEIFMTKKEAEIWAFEKSKVSRRYAISVQRKDINVAVKWTEDQKAFNKNYTEAKILMKKLFNNLTKLVKLATLKD